MSKGYSKSNTNTIKKNTKIVATPIIARLFHNSSHAFKSMVHDIGIELPKYLIETES
jgi:hypothetical protein